VELPDKHTIHDNGHVQKQFHYDMECQGIKGSNSEDSYCKAGRDQALSSISVRQTQWLCTLHQWLSQRNLGRRHNGIHVRTPTFSIKVILLFTLHTPTKTKNITSWYILWIFAKSRAENKFSERNKSDTNFLLCVKYLHRHSVHC